MITTKEIANLINGGNALVEKASYYFNVNDTTIRVSNHLPNRSNWENNENSENAIFVFVGLEMNETQIEKYLSNEFSFDFQYFLIDENYLTESIQLIKNQL
jgi:hypothetical protein